MATVVRLEPGKVFAKDYRVVRPLAEGGMGAVYVVEQLSTGHQRALKVMHPQIVEDPKSRERFTQEARVGAQIRSAHVVEVAAAGVDEETGTPWLAMELLEGEDLAALLKKRGVIGAPEALEVFEQLGDALGRAHAAGVVHRDLKPENIFISVSRLRGVPFVTKVLDFGIAKMVSEQKSDATVTTVIGSPLWMAPEQTDRGSRVGPPTDVWAMGLIAFNVLTGRYYWQSANEPEQRMSLQALLVEIMVKPLDPASQRAAAIGVAQRLPEGFDAWFAHCVARDASARFRDAAEAVAALVPVLKANAPSSAPSMAPAQVTPVPEATPASQSSDAPYVMSAPPTAPLPTSSGVKSPSTSPAFALSATVAASGELAVPPSPSRRPWVWVAAVMSVISLAAVAVALRAESPTGPARTPPTPAPTPRPSPVVEHVAATPDVTTASPLDAAVAPTPPLVASADRPQGSPPGEGRLEVRCNPRCRVSIDGVERGSTPRSLRLGSGEHSVTASRNGASQLRTVRIAADQTATVTFEFGESAPVVAPVAVPVAAPVVAPVAAPVAAPPTQSPELPNRPSRGDIEAAMRAVASSVNACGGAGRVFVDVQFASDGHATTSSVEGPLAGTPTGACIARAVLAARVPAFSRATVSVVHPFSLSSN